MALRIPGGHADGTRGFTLIELMVVVGMVAILAAIAFPAYTSYVVRTNQSAAQQFLMEVGNRQEQAMLDQREYESSLSDLNMSPASRVSDYYSITVSADNTATPPSYTITATPASTSMQSGEPTLKLHSDGTKEPADEWE